MKTEPNVEAKLKSELDAIEKRQSELKKELDGIVKRLPRLREEMADLDKDIAQMWLKSQAKQNAFLCGIRHSIQQGWREGGLSFATSVVLIPVWLAIGIALLLQKFSADVAVSCIIGTLMIWIIISLLHYKRFAIIVACFIVAAAFSIGSILAHRWEALPVSLSILGLGLAVHAFNAKADSDDRWEEIRRELKKINEELTKPTDGADQQSGDVGKKPQADK